MKDYSIELTVDLGNNKMAPVKWSHLPNSKKALGSAKTEVEKNWEKKIFDAEAPVTTEAAGLFAASSMGIVDMGHLNKSFMRRGEAEYKNNMKHVNARERLRAKLEKRKQKC